MKINRTRLDVAMLNANLGSYAEVARRMGCSAQNLSVILTRGSCKPATAAKIAAALGVPLEDLLEEGGTGR